MFSKPDLQEGKSESPRLRAQKRLLGAAAACRSATVTTIVSGLGSKTVDSLTSGDAPLLSYFVEEQGFDVARPRSCQVGRQRRLEPVRHPLIGKRFSINLARSLRKF